MGGKENICSVGLKCREGCQILSGVKIELNGSAALTYERIERMESKRQNCIIYSKPLSNLYVCVCLYVYTFVCMCTYVCMYTYLFVCVHMCLYVYICVWKYTYFCMCTYVFICVCMWLYVSMCTHVCVCLSRIGDRNKEEAVKAFRQPGSSAGHDAGGYVFGPPKKYPMIIQ